MSKEMAAEVATATQQVMNQRVGLQSLGFM